MNKILKLFGKVLTTVMKAVLSLLLFLLLTPIVYFAWRAGQPMSMPEYDGRTYYELLAERRKAYDEFAVEFQANHPGVNVKDNTCLFTEIIVVMMEIPISGRYALAAIYPDLQYTIDPRDISNGYVPENASWMSILSSSWGVYEMFVWGTIQHTTQGPVPYCRIPAP